MHVPPASQLNPGSGRHVPIDPAGFVKLPLCRKLHAADILVTLQSCYYAGATILYTQKRASMKWPPKDHSACGLLSAAEAICLHTLLTRAAAGGACLRQGCMRYTHKGSGVKWQSGHHVAAHVTSRALLTDLVLPPCRSCTSFLESTRCPCGREGRSIDPPVSLRSWGLSCALHVCVLLGCT